MDIDAIATHCACLVNLKEAARRSETVINQLELHDTELAKGVAVIRKAFKEGLNLSLIHHVEFHPGYPNSHSLPERKNDLGETLPLP